MLSETEVSSLNLDRRDLLKNKNKLQHSSTHICTQKELHVRGVLNNKRINHLYLLAFR
jgi:hypothetical protein